MVTPRCPRTGRYILSPRTEAGGHMPDRDNLNFPILSDVNNSYATSLNLALWVGAKLQQYMTGIGRMLLQCQGNDSWMLPIPATFVVGKGGRISRSSSRSNSGQSANNVMGAPLRSDAAKASGLLARARDSS